MSTFSTSADSSFTLQLVRYGLISIALHIYTINKLKPSFIFFFFLTAVGLLSRQWLSIVTKAVPESYLDEVFHIPQAQVYCDGKWSQWDDKITTPPGLYVLTILANRLTGLPCSAYYLRTFNVEVISYLALAAIRSRTRIEKPKTDEGGYSSYAAWTGINVALFPALFFFSGLYYTDVISTFVVLLAYTNHLGRFRQDTPSLSNHFYTIFLGLLALCMRQTNIFWVVVYMGGLEVVRSIKAVRPRSVATPEFTTLSEQIEFYIWRYSLGDIHDPSLNLASPVVIMGAFVGFVAWNGGVVLGDKSNHVATLHLAQMLYIWPLFAFFSAPLFIPQLMDWSVFNFQTLTGSAVLSNRTPTTKGGPKPSQSAALKTFNWLGSCRTTHSIVVLAGALGAATLIVRYNTIIHPFTLADNRHYMFYVFRYTILRARWIRYALVPIYVLCGWLCWTALRGTSFPTEPSPSPADEKQPASSKSGTSSQPNRNLDTASPPTSTALVLLLSAALSLATAPLVEPRYFILPWVFWRLLVPARPALPASVPASGSLVSRWLVSVLETAWFLLVNAVTMYIFITRPFYWRAPDGTLLDGGRVQRFMW
ncbi:hypothetical protein Hte_005799 [Hypoxylon texense]